MQIDSNHAYAKLTYDLPNQGLALGHIQLYPCELGDLYAPIHDLI